MNKRESIVRHNEDHKLFDFTKVNDMVQGRYLMEKGYTGYFSGSVVRKNKDALTILVESGNGSRSWYSIKSLKRGDDWYV